MMCLDLGGKERWIILAITCTGAMMGPLDTTIVSVSLPTIAQSLDMDYATSAWIPTSYLLSLAVLLLTMGRISDLYGRKAIFILGFAVFVLGSFLCSVSTSGNEMILFRALQGSGAACITATSAAIITATFPPQERGKALGINAMSVYLGLSLGPPLGSFLTGALGWQSIFWVNIPIGAAVIALAVWKLREGPREVSVPRFDVSGAFSFGVGLISLLTALTLGEERGWTSVPILGSLVLSGISFALFIIIEHRRGAEAMLDLRLFTENRLFAMANLSTLLNYTAYFGISFLMSFYLQRVLGHDLYLTGMVLLSMPLVMSVLSPFMGWSSDRVGSRVLASGGMLLIGLSLLLLSTLGTSAATGTIVLYLAIAGLGMGMFSSPNTSAIMGSVSKRQLGVASGTVSTMRSVGQSLSLALMVALVASMASPAVVSELFSSNAWAIPPGVAEDFVEGMALAFRVSAVIAFLGALTSLARGTRAALEPGKDGDH